MTASTLVGGRYRIEALLGRGGMAAVYLARDESLGRTVAVKVVDESLAADDAARRRLLREARLAARLAHPNVVRIYDAGEEEGRPYIVMEHVDGPTLAEELARRGRLPPPEVVRIGAEICAALAHAGAAGLVHRDVKPQNLLLAPDGTVKLADFGIARAADTARVTLAGTVVGTAAYLAPEQAGGEDVGPAADVYALGAVLYELLTGRPPYTAGTLAEVVALHAGGRAKPPSALVSGVPPTLDAPVLACLRPDPAARPTASELAVALGRALVPDPSTVALAPRPDVARRPRGRLALLGAAAVLATGAGLGFALSGEEAARQPTSPGEGEVRPIATTDDPAKLARELARWLRQSGSP